MTHKRTSQRSFVGVKGHTDKSPYPEWNHRKFRTLPETNNFIIY